MCLSKMSNLINLLLSLICSVVVSNDAARILAMYPTPSISHQVVFRPLMQELAKRGHEVVVITTDPAFPKGQTPANLTEIDVHDISYEIIIQKNVVLATKDLLVQIKLAFDILQLVFEKQIQHEDVQKIIQNKNRGFDLLMVEALSGPALGLSHIYKVPVIKVSSFGPHVGNREVVGAPTHPLLYPLPLRQKLNNLTWWDKITEGYNNILLKNVVDLIEDDDDKLLKKLFGPEIPPIKELSNNVDMMFLNIHPLWEGNHPVPPAVIYMGGLHQIPQKELPQDLKTFLDSSINGVIYMSFGTIINPSTLPPETIQTFVRVFSKLPYEILWKWDKDVLPGRSKNIRISKWLPQSDLLRHPKIKLFVTQGGLQSTDEALTAGVPLLGIPLLGDQWYNVEKYVQHKIGIRLDLETLTDEKFETAINTVIEDESYRRNVVALNKLMRDQRQSSLERAVWWTEHVLRHGGARHLRAPAANISWREYLELDIVLTPLFILLLLLLFSLLFFLKFHRS